MDTEKSIVRFRLLLFFFNWVLHLPEKQNVFTPCVQYNNTTLTLGPFERYYKRSAEEAAEQQSRSNSLSVYTTIIITYYYYTHNVITSTNWMRILRTYAYTHTRAHGNGLFVYHRSDTVRVPVISAPQMKTPLYIISFRWN